MTIEVDFTRPPTDKEKARLQRRRQRLSLSGYREQVEQAYENMRVAPVRGETLTTVGLRLRHEFSYGAAGADGNASDRRAPPRISRPPATRISSSRGSALRLMLVALSVTQLNRRMGGRANVRDFQLDVQGRLHSKGWTDLLAVPSIGSAGGRTYMSAADKGARVVRSALDTLALAGLVALPDFGVEGDRYARFTLLDERGSAPAGRQEEYKVPGPSESVFVLPPGMVTNGWVHVLDDSELALILMLACGRGGWDEDGYRVIPAEVRLQNYGIHRDAYSSARKTLEWFGLLDVREVGRHEDGRSEDDERMVHRMRLIPSGFDSQPMIVMPEVLRRQITRR